MTTVTFESLRRRAVFAGAVILAAGALALARLEAVILPGILYFYTKGRMRRRLLYGALTGLALTFLWNLSISGELFSTSARMKAYWATLYDPYPLFRRGMGQAVIPGRAGVSGAVRLHDACLGARTIFPPILRQGSPRASLPRSPGHASGRRGNCATGCAAGCRSSLRDDR